MPSQSATTFPSGPSFAPSSKPSQSPSISYSLSPSSNPTFEVSITCPGYSVAGGNENNLVNATYVICSFEACPSNYYSYNSIRLYISSNLSRPYSLGKPYAILMDSYGHVKCKDYTAYSCYIRYLVSCQVFHLYQTCLDGDVCYAQHTIHELGSSRNLHSLEPTTAPSGPSSSPTASRTLDRRMLVSCAPFSFSNRPNSYIDCASTPYRCANCSFVACPSTQIRVTLLNSVGSGHQFVLYNSDGRNIFQRTIGTGHQGGYVPYSFAYSGECSLFTLVATCELSCSGSYAIYGSIVSPSPSSVPTVNKKANGTSAAPTIGPSVPSIRCPSYLLTSHSDDYHYHYAEVGRPYDID